MCFGYSLLVRKMNVGNKKFEAICAYCGNSTTVPFKPDGERNVYCRENQDCRTKDTEYRKMNPNIYDFPTVGEYVVCDSHLGKDFYHGRINYSNDIRYLKYFFSFN